MNKQFRRVTKNDLVAAPYTELQFSLRNKAVIKVTNVQPSELYTRVKKGVVTLWRKEQKRHGNKKAVRR